MIGILLLVISPDWIIYHHVMNNVKSISQKVEHVTDEISFITDEIKQFIVT